MAASRFPILRGADVQQSRVQDNVSAVLSPVAKALQNTPIMGAAPPAWIRPTLLNGWANFGGIYATAAFHRDALGYVHLRGTLAGTGAGTVAFVLPMGYRPGAALNPGINTNAGLGSLIIETNGNVTMFGGIVSANIDCLTFLAEG